MSRPKRSDAYPASMHTALARAFESGSLFIPCSDSVKPAALRLHFYGLFGALRAENRPEYPDSLTITLSTDPPGITLMLRDLGAIDSLVTAALGNGLPSSPPPAEESPETLFQRILAGKKP